MTDISVSSTSYQVEDRSWLGSAHGTEATESITLDISAFTAATHYPDGYIPSGIVLGKITATGLYGPYDNAAATGAEVARGHLFSAVKVPDTADTTVNAGGALFTHGKVRESNLPSGHGLDANAKTDLAGSIRYI